MHSEGERLNPILGGFCIIELARKNCCSLGFHATRQADVLDERKSRENQKISRENEKKPRETERGSTKHNLIEKLVLGFQKFCNDIGIGIDTVNTAILKSWRLSNINKITKITA